MYTVKNYRTKKAVKEAVKSGESVETFQPGGMFEGKRDGAITLEGPHYPEPHRWYASAIIKEGVIISMK
jgi:hypothetical protein